MEAEEEEEEEVVGRVGEKGVEIEVVDPVEGEEEEMGDEEEEEILSESKGASGRALSSML